MPLNAKLVAAGILVTLFFSSVMFYAGQRLRQQREEDDPPSPDTSSSSSSSSTPSTSRHLEDRLMRINSEYLELFRNAVMNRLYNDYKAYRDGRNIPPHANAMTMAGTRRVDHFANVVAAAIADDVPGDIIETGVWRGGAAFLAAKVVDLLYEGGSSSDDRPAANNKKGTAAAEEKGGIGRRRVVYLSDSFRGIPPMPEAKHASDREAWEWDVLNNNRWYQYHLPSTLLLLLLTRYPIFFPCTCWPPAWTACRRTRRCWASSRPCCGGCPGTSTNRCPRWCGPSPRCASRWCGWTATRTTGTSVLRCSGVHLATIDRPVCVSGSTMQALDALYPRLSVGGYLIVDDYR